MVDSAPLKSIHYRGLKQSLTTAVFVLSIGKFTTILLNVEMVLNDHRLDQLDLVVNILLSHEHVLVLLHTMVTE